MAAAPVLVDPPQVEVVTRKAPPPPDPFTVPEDLIPVPSGSPKVDIMVCTYRYNVVAPIMAIREMELRARKSGIDARLKLFGNALVEDARAQAAAARREDYDYLLFVDDDMVPGYPDAVKYLVDLDVPVVAPLFTTRSEPVSLTVKQWDAATDSFKGIESLKEAADDKILMGPFCLGLAFTLIRRDAFEKVVEYHLSGQDWLDENRKLLDRLHVRMENRERERRNIEIERRAQYAKDRVAYVFDRNLQPFGVRPGEDIAFGRRLLRCGIDVALDCRLEMAPGHVGTYAFGIWDMGTPNNREEFYRALRGPKE
jgi:hypothetical protein